MAILPPKADFAKKLEYLMQREGYSKSQLGKELNLKSCHVKEYLDGKNRPGIERLRKLSKIFDVSIEWLLRTEK